MGDAELSDEGGAAAGMATEESPCVGVCKLDARDVCIGCGRHIDEIAAAGARRQMPQES
jgi:predicted Fe-S protein YdhL (DUF1289 family)